jgi:hypothetical protein
MTRDSHKPRIYADFQKWRVGDERTRSLVLTCKGTFNDLARLGIQLTEGLEATFYMDDLDRDGRPDDLEADGIVHFDEEANHWIASIDMASIRHSSGRD